MGRVLTGHQLQHGKRRGGRCGIESPPHGFPGRPAHLASLPPANTRGSKGQPRRAMAKSKKNTAKQTLSYRHNDKRKNNPPVGMVDTASDRVEGHAPWVDAPPLDSTLTGLSGPVRRETRHRGGRVVPAQPNVPRP